MPPTMWREKCLSQHRLQDQHCKTILWKGFLIDGNHQCRWHRRPCDKCDFLGPTSDLQNNAFKQSLSESNASYLFSWPNYNRLDQRWLSHSSAAKPQAPLWAYNVLCGVRKRSKPGFPLQQLNKEIDTLSITVIKRSRGWVGPQRSWTCLKQELQVDTMKLNTFLMWKCTGRYRAWRNGEWSREAAMWSWRAPAVMVYGAGTL